jgi:hypothetical protein
MTSDNEAGQRTVPLPNVPSRLLRTENEIFRAGLADGQALGEHPSPKKAEQLAALLRPYVDQPQAPDR